MEYKNIIEGIFLKRPNRFIAHVLINDKEEIVHVKSTGRLDELLLPGAKVILEDCTHNINRKTKYSLIAVWKKDMLVNIDSQVPNEVMSQALLENKIQGLDNLIHLKREVPFRNSRYDIYFESQNQKGFIEVKGVTLENDGISMFPGAPTERGAKHVLEMIEAVKQGYRGIILFLIQMKGPKIFRLHWQMDSKFSVTTKLASENGVEILAYDSIVKSSSIYIGNPIKIDLVSKS